MQSTCEAAIQTGPPLHLRVRHSVTAHTADAAGTNALLTHTLSSSTRSGASSAPMTARRARSVTITHVTDCQPRRRLRKRWRAQECLQERTRALLTTAAPHRHITHSLGTTRSIYQHRPGLLQTRMLRTTLAQAPGGPHRALSHGFQLQTRRSHTPEANISTAQRALLNAAQVCKLRRTTRHQRLVQRRQLAVALHPRRRQQTPLQLPLRLCLPSQSPVPRQSPLSRKVQMALQVLPRRRRLPRMPRGSAAFAGEHRYPNFQLPLV